MKIVILALICQICFGSNVGEIAFFKGSVTVNDQEIKRGHKLFKNDVIKTAKRSFAVIKLIDSSTIKLNKNSSLKISSLLSKTTPTSISLLSGSSFFNVIKRKIIGESNDSKKFDRFRVQTKTASMGVRGTIFYVSITDKTHAHDTWMCVKEGRVETSKINSQRKLIVRAGEGLKVSKEDKIQDPSPLPWTGGLNWNFLEKENVENDLDIKDAYSDLLDQDYD